MTEDDGRNKIALAEYNEVLTQFRALTDIRFKLLTYLPLGTVAAAVFVAPTNDLVKQPAISAFAFVVTLCIATYNKRNDQHYDELISRAAELERDLQIEHGTFSDRPKSWLKYGMVPVEHRWPIGLIYAASASLWAYLFTAALVKNHPRLTWLQLVVPAVVIAGWKVLHSMETTRSDEQREAVRTLMVQLIGPPNKDDSQGQLVETIVAKKKILGVNKEKAEQRVAHHWKEYEKKRDPHAAGILLAAITDLPGRWIEDVWSGRR
jgi:hypothetical protein